MALEVTLSLQRLVKKYGQELHVVAWDAVLDIIQAVQQEIKVWEDLYKDVCTNPLHHQPYLFPHGSLVPVLCFFFFLSCKKIFCCLLQDESC